MDVYDSVTGKVLCPGEEAQHREVKRYEKVLEFFTGGYGGLTAVALMDCVERYLPSYVKEGSVPCDETLDCHWALCALLKAVLKDEYGVDLEFFGSVDERRAGNGSV